MPTIIDLGKKVKQKYPGVYDDLSDIEVGKRVKTKFPGAYDDFREEKATFLQKYSGFIRGNIKKAASVSPEELALGFGPAPIGTIKAVKSAFPQISERLGEPMVQRGAKRLFQSAIENVGDVLRPTKEKFKKETTKIAKDFIEKAPITLSLKGLLSRAEQKVGQLGEEIGTKFEQLPKNSKDSIKPILTKITEAQNKLFVKGTEKIPLVNQTQHQALKAMKDEIIDIAGNPENIPTQSLRSYLQELDKAISASGKGFAFNPADKANLAAQKVVANTIRNEMAKTRPDIAKINKEFTFYKRIQEITEATLERKVGQVGGLRQTIAQAGGTAAGGLIGGVPGAVAGGFVTNRLQGIFDSPAFKLISMKTKNKAAKLMSSGEFETALELLERNQPIFRSVYDQSARQRELKSGLIR